MDLAEAIATRVALNIGRLCTVRQALSMVKRWEKLQPYWSARLVKVRAVLIEKERKLEADICHDMNAE